MQDFTKTIHPGDLAGELFGRTRAVPVFCKITYTDGRLSISGVEGPLPSGNAVGSCGQIEMGYAHRNPDHDDARYNAPKFPTSFVQWSTGWDADRWYDFLDAWHTWHLNDMRAECAHQRELGWTYDTHRGQNCPTCGYQIGTEWKREEVPADVLTMLSDLPTTDRTPAWV